MRGILFFDCPHFAHIRHQFCLLYQEADGAMQYFLWHKDQRAVCHCLAASLNLADDSNQGRRPHELMLAEWTGEFLSPYLNNFQQTEQFTLKFSFSNACIAWIHSLGRDHWLFKPHCPSVSRCPPAAKFTLLRMFLAVDNYDTPLIDMVLSIHYSSCCNPPILSSLLLLLSEVAPFCLWARLAWSPLGQSAASVYKGDQPPLDDAAILPPIWTILFKTSLLIAPIPMHCTAQPWLHILLQQLSNMKGYALQSTSHHRCKGTDKQLAERVGSILSFRIPSVAVIGMCALISKRCLNNKSSKAKLAAAS